MNSTLLIVSLPAILTTGVVYVLLHRVWEDIYNTVKEQYGTVAFRHKHIFGMTYLVSITADFSDNSCPKLSVTGLTHNHLEQDSLLR